MDRRTFILVNEQVRGRASDAVYAAPEGYQCIIQEPTRNLDQNAMLWSILTAFSGQLMWPVNGELVRLEPEEWKDILTAAYSQETRIAKGLNGGMVILGTRTSTMGKKRFAEFMEFVLATAVDRDVHLREDLAQP